MSHKSGPGGRDQRRPGAATTAICGLVAYQTRDAARRAAKTIPRHASENLRARGYRCVGGCELWPAGVLPQPVVEGGVPVGEGYGLNGREPMRDVLLPILERVRRRTGGSAQILRR